MNEALLPFEQMREAITKDGVPQPSAEVVTAASRLLDGDIDLREDLENGVFPNGIPIDASFYHILTSILSRLGYQPAAPLIVGRIWSHALSKFDAPQQQSLLLEFLSAANRGFFPLSAALPIVIEKVRLPPAFLLAFLTSIGARVANDLMQVGYWRSLENWATFHPSEALIGLQSLTSSELDDRGIAMSAALLGSLRITWEKNPASANPEYEEKLKSHADVSRRLVYHRSWINTAWARGLTLEEFRISLDRMAAGVGQEKAEVLNFLRCLLPDRRISKESRDLGIQWLHHRVKDPLTDELKHFIVNIVRNLTEQAWRDAILMDQIWPLLRMVQPIADEYKATWQELEQLLIHLLSVNFKAFEDVLLILVDSSPEIIQRISQPSKFEHLLSLLATNSQSGFYAAMLFSIEPQRRRFAFALYSELPLDTLSTESLKHITDDEFALAISEFKLHYLDAEHTARFLKVMLGHIERRSDQLKQFFYAEVLHQAKNFPGGVLKHLKDAPESTDALRNTVADAERYFDQLREAHNSPINSMEVPGWRRALSIKGRRQSGVIEAGSEEMSVFTKLVTKSYLIYGTGGFRSSFDGNLSPPTEMKTFSAQIEIPRLPSIDPEGETIRRLHAGRLCDEIVTGIRKKREQSK